MKQFLKENSYQSVRMMLYQVALTIFALMLIFAVTVYGDKSNANNTLNDSLLAIVSILSVIFYLYLLYYLSYEMGQKDGLRIKGGRMHLFRWKGFFISLIANIPNLLLGLLEFIGDPCNSSQLCNAKYWVKLDHPIFQQANGVYGPGHASFFASPDGSELWCAYHGRRVPDTEPGCVRFMYLQKIDFDESGFPVMGEPLGSEVDMIPPSGEIE